MKNEPFVIERILDAPVERVWKAITDKNDMKQWYFDLPAFEPKVGCNFSFEGCSKDNTLYLHLCTVMEVIPLKKISYTWRYDGYEGDSLVTFELFAEGNKTKLKLSHAGLESFPASNPDLAKGNFAEGWTDIIGRLLPEYLAKESKP